MILFFLNNQHSGGKLFVMNSQKIVIVIIFLCFLVSVVGCGGGNNQKVGGKIPQTITLPGSVKYEIKSPSNIEEGKKYPLFFFLSPAGALGQFHQAVLPVCEELQVFYGGSFNYRNGEAHTVFMPAIMRSIQDIVKTHPVDGKRVYLCGFSGGGMASYVTAYFNPGKFRGVIANNGVMHENIADVHETQKMKIKGAVILSGSADKVVSSILLKQNAALLKKSGVETLFIPFSGKHQVAGSDQYQKAMKWLLNQ
jgi:predicted esterase